MKKRRRKPKYRSNSKYNKFADLNSKNITITGSNVNILTPYWSLTGGPRSSSNWDGFMISKGVGNGYYKYFIGMYWPLKGFNPPTTVKETIFQMNFYLTTKLTDVQFDRQFYRYRQQLFENEGKPSDINHILLNWV